MNLLRQVARHWVLFLSASLCGVLAITIPFFWFLAPVSLAFFFFDVWRLHTLGSAALRGFVFGLISGGAGVWWLWDTLPLDWLGITNPVHQWYFVLASWAPATLTFGLVTMLFTLLIWKLRSVPGAPIITAGIWMLMEEARMWGFSFLTIEERYLFGPHFSPTAFGYPLAENPYLLQIAANGGIHMLDFTVALMGAVLAASFIYIQTHAKRDASMLFPAGVVMLCVLLLPLTHQPIEERGERLSFGLLTTDLPLISVKEKTSEKYLAGLQEINSVVPDVDVAVLPEEMNLEAEFASGEEKKAALENIFGDRNVLVMSSKHLWNNQDFTLTLTYETTQGEYLGSYSKMFLMPGGEYIPFLMRVGISLVSDTALAAHDKGLARRALPGSEVVAVPYRGHVLGGLICSDYLSPVLNRTLARDHGATILINLANPAWFHYSKSLFAKTMQISKVHAVENRSYYLQATNGAPSFALNPKGQVLAETPWFWTGVLPVVIPGAR